MVGVTGSIPVAPTTQSSYLTLRGDLPTLVRYWAGFVVFAFGVSPFLSDVLGPFEGGGLRHGKIPFLAVDVAACLLAKRFLTIGNVGMIRGLALVLQRPLAGASQIGDWLV